VKDIVARMEAEGKEVQRDAFGHVKLDSINPGKYFADTIATMIGAEKVLVQKSGYFARAAPSNKADLKLITETAHLAVKCAVERTSGVCALDEDHGDKCVPPRGIARATHAHTARPHDDAYACGMVPCCTVACWMVARTRTHTRVSTHCACMHACMHAPAHGRGASGHLTRRAGLRWTLTCLG
jgi:hypothetical protein